MYYNLVCAEYLFELRVAAMVMKLDSIVPFGRSLDEYKKMFNLSNLDLEKNIVSVADGPASFNAEMFTRGKFITSIDPLYEYSAADIKEKFYQVVDDIICQVKASPDDWVWSYHRSPENLKDNRIRVLNNFLSDYNTGKQDGRYLIGELPNLSFGDGQFQLALCSHFLFLYSDQLSYEFHCLSVLELLRVAREVRIFPLLTLMLDKSPYLQPIIEHLAKIGFSATVERVEYEMQKGGNEMLRIRRVV